MAKKLYGTDPDQVPTNADLGTIAYQDSDNAVMVDPLFQHDDSRQAKFKRLDGAWATIEINAGSTTGNSRIAFTDPDTENQVAQNTADGMIDYEHSGDSLRFYTDQSLAAQFTSSGNLLFPDGQGIDFSASAGGGATSSLLDDYEEGTWTPAFTASTTTISINSATYTKIGRRVNLQLYIGNISPATSSDQQTITGLPFSVAGSDDYPSGSISYSVDADVAGLGVLAVTGGSYIYFHYIDGTKSGSATRNDFNSIKSSGLALIISISYNTA